MAKWGTEIERERRNRIRIALYAYAYEIEDAPLVDDATFDKLCLAIRPELSTRNKVMDKFFKEEFSPHTGQWIRKHPNLETLKLLYKIYVDYQKEKKAINDTP